MVGCGVENDELARLLFRPHEGDPVRMEQRRGQQHLLVPHERMTGVVELGENTLRRRADK